MLVSESGFRRQPSEVGRARLNFLYLTNISTKLALALGYLLRRLDRATREHTNLTGEQSCEDLSYKIKFRAFRMSSIVGRGDVYRHSPKVRPRCDARPCRHRSRHRSRRSKNLPASVRRAAPCTGTKWSPGSQTSTIRRTKMATYLSSMGGR